MRNDWRRAMGERWASSQIYPDDGRPTLSLSGQGDWVALALPSGAPPGDQTGTRKRTMHRTWDPSPSGRISIQHRIRIIDDGAKDLS
jgi:hypothetical protein